ncbi:MAG: Uncharacterized protein JWO22_1876 [Frankiales bacterium]|nr:Uncharacterized protein [Frankiales bacterium]
MRQTRVMTEPQDPFSPPPYGAPAPTPYGQPQPYGAPMPAARRNGFGIAALVLGLVSFCTFWTLVIPALALFFGMAGQRRASRGLATNGGLAIAGAVLGGLGLLGGLAIDGFLLKHRDAVSTYYHCVQDAHGNQDAVTACENSFQDDLGG